MRTHKDLTVWQKSMELVELIYKTTNKLPKSELFGLISQMQRSAISIPSNIAEGAKREHKNEYIQFLSIANGSASELETQLLLTKKLYPKLKTEIEKALPLLDEILRMLYSFMKSLRN
ncbi:MAG: four helix bundle protein [Candidatus Daviesbacteria bacterium]|nr:four helix bundle protein [Candidatus Daviesbacteria bacterium]